MEKQNKLVSVLIPVYNRIGMIHWTVDSVLQQTYKNIEIIIVDNCSTDGTYEYLQKRYEKVQNIYLYQNCSNIGPVNNWIKCLRYAVGAYIKFLWSDDILENDYLQKCIEILQDNEDVGFVYCNVDWTLFGAHKECTGWKLITKRIVNLFFGKKIYQYSSYYIGNSGKYNREIYLMGIYGTNKNMPVSASCALFRKTSLTIVDKIPNLYGIKLEDTGAGIDLLMFLQVLNQYEYFYYLDEIKCYFGVHDQSFSVNLDLKLEYWIAKKYWLDNCKNLDKLEQLLKGLMYEIYYNMEEKKADDILCKLLAIPNWRDKMNMTEYEIWRKRILKIQKKKRKAMFWKIMYDNKFAGEIPAERLS